MPRLPGPHLLQGRRLHAAAASTAGATGRGLPGSGRQPLLAPAAKGREGWRARSQLCVAVAETERRGSRAGKKQRIGGLTEQQKWHARTHNHAAQRRLPAPCTPPLPSHCPPPARPPSPRPPRPAARRRCCRAGATRRARARVRSSRVGGGRWMPSTARNCCCSMKVTRSVMTSSSPCGDRGKPASQVAMECKHIGWEWQHGPSRRTAATQVQLDR